MADDNKPDYFDGIRSHFEDTEIRVIEVPEWGLVGDKAIYAKPFNMMEKSKPPSGGIIRLAGSQIGSARSRISSAAGWLEKGAIQLKMTEPRSTKK